MVGPPGRSLTYLVPPSALPALASISGELKSCFTDAIHGGRCSLITAALHVLLRTDCKARHPPAQHHPSPIWRCLGYSVVEISRQMQISYSAGTIAQSYKCRCHFFFFSFSYPAAYNKSRERRVFSFFSNAETVNSTAVKEVLFGGLVLVTVCTRLAQSR